MSSVDNWEPQKVNQNENPSMYYVRAQNCMTGHFCWCSDDNSNSKTSLSFPSL